VDEACILPTDPLLRTKAFLRRFRHNLTILLSGRRPNR
jgi:hypothetical protein